MNMDNRKNKLLLKLMTNSIQSNWKAGGKLLTPQCPLCENNWDIPIQHLMRECESIKDKFRDQEYGNIKILTWEYVLQTIDVIVDNNYHNLIKI